MRLPGWTDDLPPEIFTFERHPAHGVKTAETQSGIVVALDTRLDDALIHEGWARDIIRNVQTLRREAGLEVSDRIHLGLQIEDTELRDAAEAHLETIASEVLATDVTFDALPDPLATREFKLAGATVLAAVARARRQRRQPSQSPAWSRR